MSGNKYGVGSKGHNIIVMLPPREMTKDEALEFAAWIAVMADPIGDKFKLVMSEVRHS
jgi:hypothetical protein